ncbi:hypothetical protein M407DRAFT_18689 [Tulasnella calospora MUT 4182]|uniref:Uncharacterized protein n=1 Tax=Tulasnella calospora MUT 4182 TaxID=1051891 RepID=A0A0C3QV09_9AGAM|nr:hypothetical protein M407DRAFT_18689 [Tulasnella calospora MUT 4182]
MKEISPPISSLARATEASSASPPQAEPIRDPRRENVHRLEERVTLDYFNLLYVCLGLAALYTSLVSSSAPGSEEPNSSVMISHPTAWVTKTFGVLFVIITACKSYLAAVQPGRRSRLQGLPAIQVDDFDHTGEAAREEGTLATSSGSLPSGTAVSGTLQPPILQHPPESAPWRGPLATQPLFEPGSLPPSPSRQSDGVETSLLDVVPSQPTNVGHPASARNRHAVAPVEQTPLPHASFQEATSHGTAVVPSQSAAWGTPSDWALHQWTFFLPLDRDKFGRVRKQPQDTRPIFSSPNCDVWKCEVEFTRPSNEHPDKVGTSSLPGSRPNRSRETDLPLT